MRSARILAPKGTIGIYHAMSRIVGGDFLIGQTEKEFLLGHMWRLADFLGLKVLDYILMDNHYHQLLETPATPEVSDKELLRRVRKYYGEKSLKTRNLEKALAQGDAAAEPFRKHYFRRMGNISEYQKLFKSGFTVWYNGRQDRKGALWMGRFESVLLEDTKEAREIIASYISLNSVRAEIVKDPAEYRFCGYAAALAGDQRLRQGIMRITECKDWRSAAAEYRLLIILKGSRPAKNKKGTISRELLLKTLREKGHLPKDQLLR